LEKNISVLAKATQVSDVAHGPLVLFLLFVDSLGVQGVLSFIFSSF
jgi:hypothetical protein